MGFDCVLTVSSVSLFWFVYQLLVDSKVWSFYLGVGCDS